jgi:hypothetical protein
MLAIIHDSEIDANIITRHVSNGSYLAFKGSGESRPMLGVKQTQNGAERDPLNTRITCVMENINLLLQER